MKSDNPAPGILCIKCPQQCLTCSYTQTAGSALCQQCLMGYYLNTVLQSCQACINSCLICSDSNTCQTCVLGYSFSSLSSTCIPCSNNCLTCL